MEKIIQKRNAGLLLLFFLWPFAAFLAALRSFGQRESKLIVYLFFILYGFTFIISFEGPDAFQYAQWLKEMARQPLSDFFAIVSGMYSDGASVDVVQPFITFMISRFTDDHRFLFAVFAAVFGFFYIKSIVLLYDKYKASKNINALIHLFFFAAIIPIFNINGFRFWTASWVFFYGAYHVVLHGRKKFLLVAFFAALTHFSFLSAGIVLLGYVLVGNRNFIYFPLFVASFFLSGLFLTHSQEVIPFVGAGLQQKIGGYTNADYIISVQKLSETSAWFVVWSGKLVLYYLLFAVFTLRYQFREITRSKELQNLYSFFLLFLSFSNFGQAIPSFGGRFQWVVFLFAALFVFSVFTQVGSKKLSLITLIGLFPMLLLSSLAFRSGFDSLNPWLFAPMPMPLIGGDVTLGTFYNFFK